MVHRDPDGRRLARRSRSWSACVGAVLALAPLSPDALAQIEKPREATLSCTNGGCHSSETGRKVDHPPAAGLHCDSCHEYASAENHLFRLSTPKRDLCTRCHTLKLDAVIHSPVVDGDCTGCHDPHGSNHSQMLRAENADGLCLTCHERGLVEKKFVHGPVAVGACVVCHEPHSSGNPNLLTRAPDQLCVDCHSEMEPKGATARHQHKPLEDGCTSCHDPHASDSRFQLEADTPNLCFTCHTGIRSDLESAALIHAPVTEQGGCTKCHNPHFTSLPRLQRAAQPDLCLSCHNQKLTDADGKELADIAALLAENPDHHGPIRDGGCTACHQPHNSTHPRLLLKEYPAEFYAPFSMERYDLCFSCHLSDLVKDQSGTGLTQFRNGDLNLHWVHVNQEKGRTCRACHEVHASKRPAHIREAVPFGNAGWLLAINYTRSEDGGSCLPACHTHRDYGRANPASNGAAAAAGASQ